MSRNKTKQKWCDVLLYCGCLDLEDKRKATADKNLLGKRSLLTNRTHFMKLSSAQISQALDTLPAISAAFSLCKQRKQHSSCSVTFLPPEWRKWWQPSSLCGDGQKKHARTNTRLHIEAFMWLYIKHSWVLVGPSVFTQRWVLTLGTRLLWAAPALQSSGANRGEQGKLRGADTLYWLRSVPSDSCPA